MKAKEYLELLKEGVSEENAIILIGETQTSIIKYRKDNPKFAKEEQKIEAEVKAEIEKSLFMAAGSGNIDAIKILDRRYHKDEENEDIFS